MMSAGTILGLGGVLTGLKIRVILLLGIWLITGCQHNATVREKTGVDTYLGLTGGVVQLLEPLHVAPGRARIFLQRGEIHRKYSVNEYVPQCSFEVDSVAHMGMTIEPDTFRITGVQRILEEVVYLRKRHVASQSIAMFEDTGAALVFAGYHFWLDSPRQPGVMRLTCHGTYADLPEAQPPTLLEIHEALGKVAQISR